MKEVDRLLLESYHIDPLQTMENGGRALSLLAKRMLDGSVAERSMVVIKLESRRLRKALEVLAQALQGRDYLLASGFSAVDTAVGYSVHLARELIGIDGLPSLEAYYARLAARPAFQRALDQAPIKAMKDAVPGLA